MASRAQVMQLLREGHSYDTAARELDIPPGRAFMIATGVPADHGGAPLARDAQAELEPERTPQTLVNPPPFNPTRSQSVLAWVKARAGRELTNDS